MRTQKTHRQISRKRTLKTESKILKAYKQIPNLPLGHINGDMYDNEPITASCVRAKRALIASYEDAATEPAQIIADNLADTMHLCDRIGIDFDERLDLARKYHLDEIGLSDDYIGENLEKLFIRNDFVKDAPCKGRMFETYGKEYGLVIETRERHPERLASLVEDSDTNETLLIKGWHFVNRIGYVIAKKDLPDFDPIVLD